MAVYKLGVIVKARREELSLSQEDLADGICSVPTLSRIENGERMPTRKHFELLMQRLGYSAQSLDFFTDRQDFHIYELEIYVRQAYAVQNYVLADTYLAELKRNLVEPKSIDNQFVILYETLLYKDLYSDIERLRRLEDAMRLTCPTYRDGQIPHILAYEEIILLNNIAINYNAVGKCEKTISILYALKNYYDRHIISLEEALRTQPMVLYNLSKMLGANGRYDECIEICDLGIRIARTFGRCSELGRTLINKAWALFQRNRIGDKVAAEIAMNQACFYFEAMGKPQRIDELYDFNMQPFSEVI